MKALHFVVLIGIIVLFPAVSWGASPGSGIAGTSHDFSAKGGGVGLCTFCHTPHKALSTLLLWNHTLSSNTFAWDATTTTAGTTFPTFKGDTYKGPTAKCLSCHDGSVAVGDIAWFREGKPSVLDSTKHDSGEFNIASTTGSMKGNHPVAMPYPYNNAKNTYNGVTTGNAAILTEWQADPTASLNIRLFNDDGSGNISGGVVAAKTGLECSSCHDPHNKASVEDLFLRGKLTGSDTTYICMKCHIK